MAKRWVIKLGSGLLTRKDGKVDRVQISRIVDRLPACISVASKSSW